MGSRIPTEYDIPNRYRHNRVGEEEDAMDDHADHESRAAPVEPVFGTFRCAANSMPHLKKESDLITVVGQFWVVTPSI